MDVDFLEANWDNDIDDLTLSQICETLENENLAFEGMCDLSLNSNEDGHGNFGVGMDTGQELVVKPEMQPDEISTRFRTPVPELKNLVSNQENLNTKSNTK